MKSEFLKKVIGIETAFVLALGLVACGNNKKENDKTTTQSSVEKTAATETTATTETQPTEEKPQDDLNNDEVTIVKFGARYDDADVWKAVNAVLAPEKIRVEVTAYDSSVNINDLLIAGDIDLNVAQHTNYMDYVKTLDDKYSALVPLGDISIASIDLYSVKYDSLEELPDGSVIAIPNDIMNGARALRRLEAAGLIAFDENYEKFPEITNIAENPKNLSFIEVASSSMISILPDVAAGFAYSPNAVDAGLTPQTHSILPDDINFSTNPNAYGYVIVFTGVEGDETNEIYQKVIEAYHTETVWAAIKEVYNGATIPVVDGEVVDISQY